jgi:hypothetical protein
MIFDDDYFDIPITDTVWILAPGPSFDLFDFNLIDKNHIVITCNSALSVYKNPNFHISYDLHSIKHYSRYNFPELLWFTRTDTKTVAYDLNLKQICVDNIIDRVRKGCGLEALYVAYYLCHFQPVIKNINYTGLDFMNIYLRNKQYYYSNRVELLPFQKRFQLPSDWQSQQHTKKFTTYNSYQAQLTYIRKLIRRFTAKKININTYSFFDFLQADYNRPEFKYMRR